MATPPLCVLPWPPDALILAVGLVGDFNVLVGVSLLVDGLGLVGLPASPGVDAGLGVGVADPAR